MAVAVEVDEGLAAHRNLAEANRDDFKGVPEAFQVNDWTDNHHTQGYAAPPAGAHVQRSL